MKCEKCGQSVPEGSVFCNHCGNPLNPEIVCPVCGKNIPANSVFCPKCGKMVRDDMRDDDAEPTQQAGVAAAGGATYNELERGRQQHSAHDRDPWDEKQREHEQQAHRKPYYPDDKDDDDDDDDDDVSSEPNHFNRNVIIGAAVVVVLIGLLLMLRNCGSSDSDDRHTVTGSDSTMLVADANGEPMAIFNAELSRNNFTGDGAVAAHALKVPGNGADRPEVIIGVTTKNDAERSYFKIYKLTQNGQVWMPELQHTQYLNGRSVNMDNSALIADIQNVPRAVQIGDKYYYYFAYVNNPVDGGTIGRVSLSLWNVDEKKLTTLDYQGPIKSRDDGRQYVYGKPLQSVNSPETRFLQQEARNVKLIYFMTEEELKAEEEAKQAEEEQKRLEDPDNVDERWNQDNQENVEALKNGEEVTMKTPSYDKPIFNMKEINKKIENEGYIVFAVKNGAVYGFNKNTRKYFSIFSPKGDAQPSDIGFADSKNNQMRMRTSEGRFSYNLVTGKTQRIPE